MLVQMVVPFDNIKIYIAYQHTMYTPENMAKICPKGELPVRTIHPIFLVKNTPGPTDTQQSTDVPGQCI